MDGVSIPVKNGIAFIGSVIVDEVSEVLEPGNLVYSDGSMYLKGEDYETEDMRYSLGGMATNNSVNLAKMGVPYPIRVIGKIGTDDNGRRIREAFKTNGISDKYLIETNEHPTSRTQVIYIKISDEIVNRTFRYYFGAMGSFSLDDINYSVLEGFKIAMVGYCLLIPYFDTVDPDYGAAIGSILANLQSMGIRTCMDFVTPKRDRWWKFKRFRKTLQWVDILTIGEDQAQGITGISDERTAVQALVEEYGVKTAVIHCGDKGENYLYSASSGLLKQPIYKVPSEEYKGNVGAGDAFASGFIHAVHQDWDDVTALKYATASSAVSLGSITCTDAMREESYILEYMDTRPVIK